jgi:hypothetical protein
MNNVHINVNDYKIKNKKQKNSNIKGRRKASLKDEYHYIKSEISKEFNENKNFIPQLKSFSSSSKNIDNKDNMNKNNKSINSKNNLKEENNKKSNNHLAINIKNKNNENKKKNNNNNFDIKETKGKVSNHVNKSKEKPVKIYKYPEQNKEKPVNQKQSKNQNINNNKKEINKNDNNRIKSPENNKNSFNNNKLKESRSKNNINKNNIKLPPIIPNSASPKTIKKNFISKSQKLNINKNYKRLNTFTPALKINNINNDTSEKKSGSLKEIIAKKMKNKKIQYDNSLSLPRLIINTQKDYSPKQSITQSNDYSKRNNNNKIQNNYGNVLENIKKDFLLLDSIKNRANTDRNNKKINYQIGNNSVNNTENNIKLINSDLFDNNKINNFSNRNIENNDNNYIVNNSHTYDKMNSYNSINSKFNLYNRNNNNNEMPFLNDLNVLNNNNSVSNRYNNMNNNDFIDKEISLGSSERKKPHTSFDIPPVLPGLKKKLDIISEEEEDDNKYITDLNMNNNFGSAGNLNTLEILMKQRMVFQNKMPNNSRFKLKQNIE